MIGFAFLPVYKNASIAIHHFLDCSLINFTSVNKLQDVPSGWVSFCVARNPYTRCVSSWQYVENLKNRPLLDCLANPPVIDGFSDPDDYDHFTKKQSEFMFHDGLRPDHILRFENLEQELSDLLQLYNKHTDARLQRLNVGEYNYTLNNEEREAIYQFYKEDFINLGYEK